MLVNIWEFYIKPQSEREFEIFNGPNGEWAEFFKGSPEFSGTNYLKSMESILKNEEMARRYLTQDRWKSREGFDQYVRNNRERFNKLSEKNERLFLEKNYIGFFELGR